jgi:anti-sigma regulatory factor (Ser/Thr protein kinase)
MVAILLSSVEDVRRARQCVVDLARAAGIPDLGAAALVTWELGNNCVEHGIQTPGLLWVGCRPGRLWLRFENRCERRPNWRTQKPIAVAGVRTGGYGLPLAQALADRLNCHWAQGRVVVRAEFRGTRASHASKKEPGSQR